jgi:hypothetical protein
MKKRSWLEKFPNGTEWIVEKLISEGFEIVRQGKKVKVKNFESRLFVFENFKL